MPAVSTKVQILPPSSTCSSTGSRVVPASSLTTTRSSPAALLSSERLADVGPADDRDAARSADLLLGDGRDLGQHGHHVVEQVGDTAAVQGGERPRLAEPEAPELGGPRVADRVVGLVGDQDHGLLRRAQHLHHVLVGRGRADVDVDDEQHGVGQVDGDLGLGGDRGVDALRVGLPAAGVDEREPAAQPLGLVGDAVARDAGGVFDDRLAAAEDAVDQRRLADVRAADDRQHRQRRAGR